MSNDITNVKREDLEEIEKYIREEVEFWNDIANGKLRFIDPMSEYSENLWLLLESVELPQADNGTIGVWTEHLSKVHGIKIVESGDFRCRCTTCRELARDIVDAVRGYIVRHTIDKGR